MPSYLIRRRACRTRSSDSVKRYIVDHPSAGDALPTEAEMVAHSGSVVSPCARLEGIADIGVVDVARAGGLVGSLSLDKLAEGLAFSPAGRQHNPCRRRTCSTCGHAPGTGDALDAAGGRPPQRCTDRDLRSMLAEMQRLDPNAPTVAARSRLHLALVRPLHSRVFSEFCASSGPSPTGRSGCMRARRRR